MRNFSGYVHEMYFPLRLSLFIVALVAQCAAQTDPEVLTDEVKDEADTQKPIETSALNPEEVYMDDEKPEGDTQKPIETTAPNSLAANSSSFNVTKVNCLTDTVYGPVEIVNATRLMKLLMIEPGSSNRTRNDKEGRQYPGTCVLVLFYARWCIFSSQAAPHFNALPRAFPHMKTVAIDAIKHQGFNAQYGIVGVPTLMFVHNGKPVAKFNGTVYTLEYFARFITEYTNLKQQLFYITPEDLDGPVSSTPSNETDYCLVLSWTFIAACALYFTSQSRWWQQFVELVQNTWRESNAQHEHAE